MIKDNTLDSVLHWAILALEATLDTIGVSGQLRTSLLQMYESMLRLYLRGDVEAA